MAPEQEPRLSEEHVTLVWAPLSDLPPDLPEAYRSVLNRMASTVSAQVLDSLAVRLERDQGDRMRRLRVAGGIPPAIGVGGVDHDH
ncbi:hypothetical protein [Sulfobacillus harzensis]|uniref:Uncharacterized protein n=1 Tax=Sulfobacillus harzensis TaxID=2729629 RepID=A0A7Y0Q2G7_9FIRM|nr:hypothetical protein [Sulfobacillus harzensis]NMP22325.1 hypothetical protein [Sulfobacillus harzensis]